MNSNVLTFRSPPFFSMLAAMNNRPSRLGFVSLPVLTGSCTGLVPPKPGATTILGFGSSGSAGLPPGLIGINWPGIARLTCGVMTIRGLDSPECSATAENVTGSCANSPIFSSAFIICSPFLGTSLSLASRTTPIAVPA